MKASSRYFSTRSRASSVVRPISISSWAAARAIGTSVAPSRPARRAVGAGAGPSVARRSAPSGTRTVTAPAWTVAVSPATLNSSPRSPRCTATTVMPGARGASVGAGLDGRRGDARTDLAQPAAALVQRRARALAALEALPLGGHGAPDVRQQRGGLGLGALDELAGPGGRAGLGRLRRGQPRRRSRSPAAPSPAPARLPCGWPRRGGR